jgi:hypothetical protein
VQTIDPSVLAQIAKGAYASTHLLLFDLVEGLFGFWGGYGPITVNSIPYVGAGSLIEISQINLGSDLAASPLTITLRALPETALSTDVLASIDNYGYKNRPAHLSLAYFDPVAGVIVTAIQWWQGYIDTITHSQTVGGNYTLSANLEPLSLDHSRIGYRMRSDADQKRIDPADRFFEFAAVTATQKLPYGRKEDGAAPQGFVQVTGGNF